MGRGYRHQMLAGEIRRLVSSMLVTGELKDPVFGPMIGISGVEVTRDGSYATIYVTALSSRPDRMSTDEDVKEILGAFERAKGFIRTAIGRNIKLRYTPELIFKFDSSFDYGARMDKILDELDK